MVGTRMNLPTIAIILEDHELGKVYGASKVVYLVNGKIEDVEKHIALNMTGKEINAIYKGLDYTEQTMLIEMDILDESETAIIVNQMELLNNASDSEGKMSEALRELIIMFGATILLIIAVGICFGYYENSRQNNAVMNSNLFSFVSNVIDKLIP